MLPHWPKERFLELCPRDWAVTRARLDTAELDRELGALIVPPPRRSSRRPAERIGCVIRSSCHPAAARLKTGLVQRVPTDEIMAMMARVAPWLGTIAGI